MKKALLIASVLFVAVVSTACINNMAVQELNNKASEYMQKGDYESAISRLQASIDLDSTMYETYYNLGIASTNAKKYETAVDAFEQGLKLNPEYTDFYYSLGVAQASWADELTEEKSDDEDLKKTDSDKEKVTEEDAAKAVELKKSAAENLKKYLELNPQAEDKSTVEELIKDCESFSAEPETEGTKTLEG